MIFCRGRHANTDSLFARVIKMEDMNAPCIHPKPVADTFLNIANI